MAKPRIELRTIDSSDQGTLEVLVRASLRLGYKLDAFITDQDADDKRTYLAMLSRPEKKNDKPN